MNFPFFLFSFLSFSFCCFCVFFVLSFCMVALCVERQIFKNQLHSYSQSLVTDAIRSILVLVQFLLRCCCSSLYCSSFEHSMILLTYVIPVRFISAQVKLSVVMKHIIPIKRRKRKQHKRQKQQQQQKVHPKYLVDSNNFAADQPNNNNGMN